MSAKREVRCEACGTVNRVPPYSIRKIPRCGNKECRAPLPESAIIGALRGVVRYESHAWIGGIIVAIIIIVWFALEPFGTANNLGKIVQQIAPSRPIQAPSCSPVEPITISGIMRVYDTVDQPALTQWTINAGYGADYFVKLVELRTGLPKVAYFVHGGSSITTDVPVGAFIVKHASGKIWCGEQQYFGQETVFQKGTNTVFFDPDYTYTLYLTPKRNGNFPTTFITRDQF